MYGYIRIHAPEMKVREQEYYRGVYCGLCRTMGKCTGQCSRATLSYDFTYFALVRMALTGKYPAFKARRCLAHPAKRRPMAEPTEDLALCACMSVILAYHKVRDDLRDERGMKRTAATAAAPFAGSLRRRALKRGFSPADAAVADAMEALNRMEASRPASVDEPAELFGELMAALLAYGLEGKQAKLARKIGRHVGRWVYVLDAADDYAEDARRGRYNPLICLYGQGGEAPSALPADKRESLRVALLCELSELECAFDLLDVPDNPDLDGVLRNILYLGMPKEAERVLSVGEACACPEDEPAERSKPKGD